MAYASRMHGQWIVDYEERVNPERLRNERVRKLQGQIRNHGLGALLLYDPSYVRYATGTRHQQLFTTQRFLRYALVFADANPMIYELVGPDLQYRRISAPWLANRIKPAVVWQYAGPATGYLAKKWASGIKDALKKEGAADLPLGVDKLHFDMVKALQDAKIRFVDGMPAVWDATNIKTRDELELLKQASAIVDAAFDRAKDSIKPGIRGYEIAGVIAETLYSLGSECIEDIIIASGGHTNPYLREITDKMVRPGDLVIMDIDPVGPGGYYSDVARTFVNARKATEEQKELYKECYENLQGILKAIRAGATTADVAKKMPTGVEQAEKYETTGLLHYGHGLGITMYEPPVVTRAYSVKNPVQLKKNMVLAIETYAGKEGRKDGVRLEDNVVVTDAGCEIISLYPHDDRLIEL